MASLSNDNRGMDVVEIREVKLLTQDSEVLCGFALNSPQPSSRITTYTIKVAGWIVGRASSVKTIEIISDHRVLRTVPVQIAHSQISERFPHAPGSARSGFWALVGILGLPSHFTISLGAVFSDGERLPLAEIQGGYVFSRSPSEETIRPLMVTSLGRTGTTWLLHLLSEHPQIVAYRRHPYEFKVARYWMHGVKVLSDPADHQQSSHPDSFQDNKSFVGHNPFFTGHIADTAALGHWFGRSQVEELAGFAQSRIESCYREVALEQGQPEPVYFAEKHLPDHIPRIVLQLYSTARELVLVRDLRDMVCSMLAFNVKRGYASFGRERANSDADFVRQLAAGVSRLREAWKERSGSAHLVRYEDLVLHPRQALSAILKYLELDGTPSVVDGILERASRESSDSVRHKTSINAQASINRWRSDLDPRLAGLCAELFHDALLAFGYLER